MSDTYVTLHGWVGNEVNFRELQSTSVASFRVASTPRLKKGGEWVDGETTWYSVTTWRGLAENVRTSVKKGDAVIVHGRLRTETWQREDGEASTGLAIDASLVGHDLSRGTSAFVRTTRTDQRGDSGLDQQVAAMHVAMHQEPATPYDSFGNPMETAGRRADGGEGADYDPLGQRDGEREQGLPAA
jgi:single-strand DNA-binding protein